MNRTGEKVQRLCPTRIKRRDSSPTDMQSRMREQQFIHVLLKYMSTSTKKPNKEYTPKPTILMGAFNRASRIAPIAVAKKCNSKERWTPLVQVLMARFNQLH